jgi:signal transduction histidine kinase
MPQGEASDLIYASQVRAVYRQIPLAVGVNFVNAILSGVVLGAISADRLLFIWLGLVVVTASARAILWRFYSTAKHPDVTARRWAMLATIASGLSGAVWGCGGAGLPASDTFEQMFLVYVVGGMCIGAVGVSAAHLPTLFAFLLSASPPIVARFLSEASEAHAVMAGMIVVFIVAVSFVGVDFHRSIVRNLRLGFELAARTRELDQASARLADEVAQHRATAAELRQAQKLEAVGQLTGGIAHDFNNLLTAVLGNLELALQRADGQLGPLLKSALHAAERGATLTQRLLAFARKQRLQPKPVDVAALAGGMEDMLRRTLGPSIRLLITREPGLWPALVDANQLELAVLNLAINGRDAMPAGGELQIELKTGRPGNDAPRELRSGEYVVLSMIDSGSGMDEVTRLRAVEPFFTTKDVGVGSGLGLAMVHGFVAQSRGAIAIRSKLGEGTTVEIWLPRADAPPSNEAIPARPTFASPHREGRILVCDDDTDVRMLISEVLRERGCSVQEADGPASARRILATGAAFDLFIVDYAMPGMDGLQLINEVRRSRPDLKVLLITGHADAPQRADAEGIAPLLKPFRPVDFALRVDRILDGKLTPGAGSPDSPALTGHRP